MDVVNVPTVHTRDVLKICGAQSFTNDPALHWKNERIYNLFLMTFDT